MLLLDSRILFLVVWAIHTKGGVGEISETRSRTLLVSRKRSYSCEEDAEITQPTTSKSFPFNLAVTFSLSTSLADPSPDPHAATAIPVNGCEWVEFLLREMQNSTNVYDERSCVSKSMEALEKTIANRTRRDSVHAENLQKQNLVLKQQVQSLSHDNSILKRAVAIQHQRHKEHEKRSHELQRVKQH